MSERRLFVSFSGGETSAEMAIRILRETRSSYDKIVIGFANTSQEDERCLKFVDKCDREFFAPAGVPVVWIEGMTWHHERKGSSHQITDYVHAKRDGSVFESMIKKYGIPNQKYLHCTRELKLNPIGSYLNAIGWEKGSYDTAVGIRADEIDRMSCKAKENRIIYPLVKWGVRKPDVNLAWRDRPFRLEMKGYESNCKWCHKKSFRKHLTLISKDPSAYNFPARMEAQYGLIGGEFNKSASGGQSPLDDGYTRKFFRGNRSTQDLMAMYEEQKNTFKPASDDSQIYPEASLFDELLDTAGGCGESCEVFADMEESE